MSAADDSDPSGRLAPRGASRLSEDALDVARFCWPEHEWKSLDRGLSACRRADCRPGWNFTDYLTIWRADNREDIAAAERVVVERGLGEEYGKWIAVELGPPPESLERYFGYVAKIATAPLDARLRALAVVARKQLEKEAPRDS